MTSYGPNQPDDHHAQPARFGAAPPGGPGKRNGAKFALIVGGVVLLLVVLCCGGGGYALLSAVPADPGSRATPTVTATRPPDSGSSPGAARSGSGGDFVKGDCVVNDGTDLDAELRRVPCGSGSYEVLSKIPFTTDGGRCGTDPVFGAPGHDANYVHDDPLDPLDYVLCLKER